MSVNKFFVSGVQDSSDSEEEDTEQMNNERTRRMRFKNMAEGLESDSEGEKRQKLTEREKRTLNLKKIVRELKGGLKEVNVVKMLEATTKLLKELDKSKAMLEKDGGLPDFVMRAILSLRNCIEEIGRREKSEEEVKLNTKNHKAYSAFRQLFKKELKAYEEEVNKYEEGLKKQASQAKAEGGEQSDDLTSDAEQDDGSESDDEDKEPLMSPDPMVRRTFWLKKYKRDKEDKEDKDEEKEKEKQKEKERLEQIQNEKRRREELQEETEEVPQEETVEDAVKKMTEEGMLVRIRRLLTPQGAKDLKLKEEVTMLKKIAAKFDRRIDISQVVLKLTMDSLRLKCPILERADWSALLQEYRQYFGLFLAKPEPDFSQVYTFNQTNDPDYRQFFSEENVMETLRFYFALMEDQLRKAFLFIEFSSPEYAQRLQDFFEILDLNFQLYEYFKRKGRSSCQTFTALKLIENLHFMNDEMVGSVTDKIPEQKRKFIEFLKKERFYQECLRVAKQVESETTKTKVALLASFHLALHGDFQGAKANFLGALNESVINQEEILQVYCNRAAAQIGLCAFRLGLYREANFFLEELCGSGKIREMLSQGSRLMDGRPRRNRIPYHMYLAVEAIECADLISAMLLEMPEIVIDETRLTSKSLKKVFEYYEKSYFIASPINSKDLIYAACGHLRVGNWRACYDRISQLYIWKKCPDSASVLARLLQKLKEQALKCYLLQHFESFESISLGKLAQSFQLNEKDVRRVVSGAINEGHLGGILVGEFFQVGSKDSKLLKAALDLSSNLVRFVRPV